MAYAECDREMNIETHLDNILGKERSHIIIPIFERRHYIQNGNPQIIKSLQRKYDLAQALSKYGLELRNDSEMCRRYITGEEPNIDEVIIIMRQMNFLYTQTNYKNMVSTAYENAKSYMYDMYGYIDDEEEYREILNSHVDKEDIKEKALKGISPAKREQYKALSNLV